MDGPVYTFSNEDSETELNLLGMNSKNIAVIAGSGARVIPLFYKSPKNVYCIDSSIQQLYLTEFRIEAFRRLEYQQFLQLMGYKKIDKQEMMVLFGFLSLSNGCQIYMNDYLSKLNWQGLLFSGNWEQSFIKTAAFMTRLMPRIKKSLNSCTNREQHLNVLNSNRLRLSIANATLNFGLFGLILWNSISGKSPHMTLEKLPNIKNSIWTELNKALASGRIIENFYYSILFTGKYNPFLAPTAEISPDRFAKIKSNIQKSKIHYVHDDIFRFISGSNIEFEFVSMSNVLDYLPYSQCEEQISILRARLSQNAKVVVRRCFPKKDHFSRLHGLRLSDIPEDLITIAMDKTPFYKTDVLLVD